jgi:acylphosphatase
MKGVKEMSKNVKVDGFVWIAENGAVDYGFFFGDADEPVQFQTTLKQLVRDTLEAYKVVGTEVIAHYHTEDCLQLIKALNNAQKMIEHELKRIETNASQDK